MIKKYIFLLLVIASGSYIFAANNIFTAGGDGVSWGDGLNWSTSAPPLSTEDAYVGYNGESANFNVILDGTAVAYQFKVGIPETAGGAYALNVETGADFQLARLFDGPRGTLNINGGTFNLNGGHSDALMVSGGKINVNSGLLSLANSAWRIVSNGNVNLNGGIFRIHNGTQFSNYSGGSNSNPNSQFTGIIDLSGGQWVMDGDVRNAIQWHVNNGNIIPSGNSPYTDVLTEYRSGENTTTIWSANRWTGNGDGYNWHDPNNWSLGTLPAYSNAPVEDFTFIGMKASGDLNITITKNLENDGIRAATGRVWLGRSEDPVGTYTLNIPAGGEYYLVRMYVGVRGILNVTGGELDTWEGRFRGCDITIDNGGVLTVRSDWWGFMDSPTEECITTINDGVLRIKNGKTFSHCNEDITIHNPDFTGTWDLCGGKVVMDGDCRTALQWHIDNGNIIAYGGADPDMQVEVVYNSATNTTTLYSNAVAAKYTWPTDGMTLVVDDRQTIQLNWQPGRDVENLGGYNIYIADPNISDPNLIALTLVSDPVVPYAGTSWQISSAALGKTYSWRVDTVTDNGSNVIPGEVWSVAIDDELLNVYVRTRDGVTKPLDYQWIACGDGTSWNDALNWHSEAPNPLIPEYTGHLGDFLESRMNKSIMTISDPSFGGQMWLGDSSLTQTVNVEDGGYWQLYRLFNLAGGTVNIANNGSVKLGIIEGKGSTVNVEGALHVVTQYWSFKTLGEGGGLKVYDGQVHFENAPASNPFGTDETGNIDIYNGTVIIDSNDVAMVEGWIADEHITAYSNQSHSVIDLYYDAENEQIYLRARDDYRKAYRSVPGDGEVDVHVADSLSWMVGDGITRDILYVTTGLQADLNDDAVVDIADLHRMAQSFLDESWELDISNPADITDDHEVNLRDLAVLSSEWQEVFTMDEVASFVHDPNAGFDPNVPFSYSPALNYETTYYWRVDSIGDSNEVIVGDIWSFTTELDPLMAENVYPVDGDRNVLNGTIELNWQTDAAVDTCNVYFADSYGEATSAGAYQATTTTGTWTCPMLTTGQRYYWRIETVVGSTVYTGKVWSFSVTADPVGLYVDSGVIKHNGAEFKGYGVNYITAFERTLINNNDTSYEQGFSTLAEKNIPFVRIFGSGFYVNRWNLYFNDKEQYFRQLDDVMSAAEENGVGVIFSMFWAWYTLPDVVGETMTDWADPASQTCEFMENYIREIYVRYKNCPAFWGWELGNEYNYSAEAEHLAPTGYTEFGHPGVRTEDDRNTLVKTRQIAANFNNAVRKVDKTRFISTGFGIRLDVATGEYGTLPERYDDHSMVDVVSIHYYGTNGATKQSLINAKAAATGWNMPLFVGEFGVSENDSLGFPTVEAAFEDMLDDLITSGVTFASTWVYDYDIQDGKWNITGSNDRSYMLDLLSAANSTLNP